MQGFRWALLAGLAAVSQAQFAYLTYPTGINPSGVTAADLNGDGKPDLVIANLGSNWLTILINDGRGGFTAAAPVNLGMLSPQSVLAADLNGDHKIDLVVISARAIPLPQGPAFSGPMVLLGNGDGTFQPPLPVAGCMQVTDAQLADLNGDGIPDLAVTCLTGGFLIPVGAYLAILPGNGDGTFGTGASYSLGFTPWAVLTIGDFNQDGKPDVAAAEGGGLTVLLNDGKANFKAVTSSREPWNFAPGIAAGDFNGDGLLDLAVSGQSLSNPAAGSVTILLGRGDGTFRTSPGLETTGFASLAAMDLNNDGHVDLVEGLSALTFFAGQGDGAFEKGRSFRGSGTSGALVLADFTGTGVMGFAGTNQLEATGGMQVAGNAVILPRAVWPLPALANVSAAGYGLGPLAPGSIVSAFGPDLAAQSAQATGTLPISLGGETISVIDSTGAVRPAQLYYVSPGQVNYVIPADTAPGLASVTLSANGEVMATGQIDIERPAPAIFVVNSDNLVAANVVRVSENGDQSFESIYQTGPDGKITALPIDLGSDTDTVYLVLYGTGIRNSDSASATIGGAINAPVTYFGPQGNYPGLDQVNLQLPRSLASTDARTWVLQLTVDGQASNQVTLLAQ